ncbi:MAG: hypothetical protein DI597_14555 [Pseudoxanthomonas spadix]|nr:MAG: hypothetical protein DI597_14555 [Pseudoxanthomonas spadix]
MVQIHILVCQLAQTADSIETASELGLKHSREKSGPNASCKAVYSDCGMPKYGGVGIRLV